MLKCSLAEKKEATIRKRVLPRLFVVGFCLLLLGCSGPSPIAGTYVSEIDPNSRFELKRNGTFELYLTFFGIALGDHGSYEVKGETVTFKFQDGTVLWARLSNGALVFPKNSLLGLFGLTVWRRK